MHTGPAGLTYGERNAHSATDGIELQEHDESVPMLALEDSGISQPHGNHERHWSPERTSNHSFVARLLDSVRNTFSSQTPVALRAEHGPPPERSISATARTIFNYPEPDLKLRSTAWLDGLRGLAAFEVFIFHYCDGWVNRTLGYGHGDWLDPAWWRLPFLRTFWASGDTAVCLFFAISGYVLSYRILSLCRQSRYDEAYSSLSSAVVRRAIRLYMPVAIETFILMLLCRLFYFPKPIVYESADTLVGELGEWVKSFVHLMTPLRYPDRWDLTINKYDGGISWTIPLEYYGSLVIFIALLFVARVRSAAVRMGLVMGMALQSFIKDDWIAGQFLLGMVFADWQLGNESKAQLQRQSGSSEASNHLRKAVFWGLFVFGFYLAGIPVYHLIPGENGEPDRLHSRPFFDWLTFPLAFWGLYRDRQLERSLQCMAGYAIILGVGEIKVLKRMTMARFVQYLGKISFGLYLCHIWIHGCLKSLDKYYIRLVGLDPAIPSAEREESVQLFIAYLLMMGPSIIINFIVAGCFERYLDKPSVNAGKRFEKWVYSRGQDAKVQLSNG